MVKYLGFDTETWPIRPGLLAPRMVCGSFSDEPAVLLREPALHRLEDLLRGEAHLVGHNIAFDVAVTCEAHPEPLEMLRLWWLAYRDGRIHDTMIRARLLDLARGVLDINERTGVDDFKKYSLASQVKARLGKDISGSKGPDAWRLRYAELDGVTVSDWPPEAYEYAADDAQLALAVFRDQGLDPIPDEQPQTLAALALHLQSVWGARTDGETIAQLRAKCEAEIGNAAAKLHAAGIADANGKITIAKLEERISEAYGGQPPRGQPTEKMLAKGIEIGNIKRSARVLVESDDPLLAEWGRTSVPRHHLRTTLPAIEPGVRHPINTRFHILKATGRTSSSHPNLQNIPVYGGFREAFVPRPGFLLCACDYSQLELCTFAQVQLDFFGRSKMAEAIREGLDLHLVLAASLLGREYGEVSKETHGSERQLAKAANYGFPGGMGAARFLDKLEEDLFKGRVHGLEHVTLADCRKLRAVWFDTWPEAREYLDQIGREDELGLDVVQPRSGRVRGGCTYCDRANTTFQGLASDGAREACIDVAEACYLDRHSPLYGSRPLMFVHDELIVEVLEDRAGEAGDEVSRLMVAAMEKFTPDVPIEAEPALMRRWSKGAATARDEEGGLICSRS